MRRILLLTLLVAGYAQPSFSAEAIQAVPGRAVIYVVRTPLDSRELSGLVLGDAGQVGMQPGTYYRWEAAPGTHRVVGMAPGVESLTLTAAAGGIYFLEHTVVGDPNDGGIQFASLRQIGEQAGRNLVTRSQMLR